MIEDYVTALATGEDLDTVRRRLYEKAKLYRRHLEQRADADLEEAKVIQAGLQQPKNSAAYRVALAFMEDAQDTENQKTEAQRVKEAEQRAVEREYLDATRAAGEAARQQIIKFSEGSYIA